jgi:hypothetical protein
MFYTSYIIYAFQEKNLNSEYVDYCELKIIANSEKEAIKKAKDLVTKNEYEVKDILEIEKLSDNKYSVFVFQAYNDIEGGKFTNLTIVDAIAKDSKEAEKLAKSRIAKKHYRLLKVIENYANS